MEYYNSELDEVFKALKSSPQGLSTEQAQAALSEFGPNELVEAKKISPLAIFVGQFKSFIVGILLFVLLISLVMGEFADAIAVLAILVLNAVLGFIQEYKAEKAIEALKKMATPKAHVLRMGRETVVDSKEVVPGDIMLLATGDKIPADGRVIESVNLQTQEAALTGESVPIEKDDGIVKLGTPVANRSNMVFSSTIVTKGRGKAIVTGTGMSTEFGRIAKLLQEVSDEETPLQKKLAELGKTLGIMSIIACAIIFIISLVKDGRLPQVLQGATVASVFRFIKEPLTTSVALAVAAIPEGLPAVVTIALALGVQRMIKRNALIRKLPSVETLGATSVICSDKTGTLTHNEMTVMKIYANNRVVDVTGSGYSKEGSFSESPDKFELILKIGALNNDSRIDNGKVIGDPTEGCLIVTAEKAGFDLKKLKAEFPRVDEVPFESERKLMTTIHSSKKGRLAFTKGAPDRLLHICDSILIDGQVKNLTPAMKREILGVIERFSESALRVLGFAYRGVGVKESKKEIEQNMIFVGLQAMIDPPRDEVKLSIAKCKTAGIKVVMITGDYVGTAKAIARELGIEGKAVTGEELDNIEDLDSQVEEIGIYARVNPEHKMRIVEAFKNRGHVVAMTGDGVNDAPAIKKADIGIAMGITGTDVAKEASDVVLTDDNFTSIVNAVEEGRGIYANIKNFVFYLVSCNIGEVLTILFGLLLGLPAVLFPLQILMMNLLTDGLPALALGVEPAEKDIMKKKPRKPDEKIFSGSAFFNMMSIAIIIATGTLLIFRKYVDADPLKASAMAFTTLVVFQMFNAFNTRAGLQSIFSKGLFSNRFLIFAVLTSMILQLVCLYTPLSGIINKGPVFLNVGDWVLIILVSSSVVIIEELIKRTILKEEFLNGGA